MTTLYHGTNKPIVRIDLTCGASHKDFGKGFYLTPDSGTALRMARKRTWLDGGSPVLLTYEFDERALTDPSISTKTFTLDREWIETDKLTKYLIEDYGLSIADALDRVYRSRTFELLLNPETGLYTQSPAYTYEILRSEEGLNAGQGQCSSRRHCR